MLHPERKMTASQVMTDSLKNFGVINLVLRCGVQKSTNNAPKSQMFDNLMKFIDDQF